MDQVVAVLAKYLMGLRVLGLFWMFNTIAIAVYHFSWKMQSDVWGTIDPDGNIAHITGGNFAQCKISTVGCVTSNGSQSVRKDSVLRHTVSSLRSDLRAHLSGHSASCSVQWSHTGKN